ncbi:S41 family peptidase [Gaetbulibacter aquiaggeris]|uniref:S41 family peptidase n=1 Tax=Gaetbulibacter aquiaggeris TaxID=1735373 RepID=A0ABW7MQ78_9FLAO
MKEDFGILKNIVCEVSPNLNSKEKEALYNYLNERSEELNGKTMTVIEFFKFLMDTKANTKLDEHGTISLSNDVMKEFLADKSVLFPIPIIIIDNKLIVNHDTAQIPYGSVITDINGIPVATILDNFLKEKTTYALRNLEVSFDILFLIKYGAPNSYAVRYTTPNSNVTETILLEPLDIKTRENVYNNIVFPLHREQLKNLISTAYFEDSNSFCITLNSFNWKEDVKNVYEIFDKQFSDIFKTIKKQKPKNLIIDLRYNRGGNILIPALFYSYITQKEFNEDIHLRVPDFDLPYKNYIEKIGDRALNKDQVDEFLNNFQKPFTKNNDYYEFNYVNNEIRKPKKNNYEGNVYLMIGGRNFSGASYFTAIFKNYNRGRIIGEQIGGSHHNITAGKQIEYVLPNTKIKVSLPIGVFTFSKDLETNVSEKKINPDVLVSEKIKYQYFLKKEDWDLQEVFLLINKLN